MSSEEGLGERHHWDFENGTLLRAERERLMAEARKRLTGQQLRDTLSWLRGSRRTNGDGAALAKRWTSDPRG